MSKPKDYALNTVQDWVCSELNYGRSGMRAKIAKGSSSKALEWWAKEGFLQFGAIRADGSDEVKHNARIACRTFVRSNYRYGNPLIAIIFSIIIQVVISAIVQIIIDWLFSDTEGAEYYGKIYNVD
jgi:hypothetical protein